MRFTKKEIKKRKDSHKAAIVQLLQCNDKQLKSQLQSQFKGMTITETSRDECLRMLLIDSLEREFPDGWLW